MDIMEIVYLHMETIINLYSSLHNVYSHYVQQSTPTSSAWHNFSIYYI